MRFPSWLAPLTLAAALHPTSLAAQLSDEDLFHQGQAALQHYDYVNALADLFAYSHRYPVAMQLDPVHRQQVSTAIQTSDKYLRDVITHERQLIAENQQLREKGGIGSSVSGLTVQPPALDDPGKPPPSYRMACRGGGDMAFRMRSSGFGLVGLLSTMEFRRSATAGAESLAPGECSWLDRPINPDEPNRVCHRLDPSTFDLGWSVDGTVKGLSSTSAPYVGSLVSSDGTFSFMVFNNGQGCMVQTEPFKTDPRVWRGKEKVDPRAVRQLVKPQR